MDDTYIDFITNSLERTGKDASGYGHLASTVIAHDADDYARRG